MEVSRAVDWCALESREVDEREGDGTENRPDPSCLGIGRYTRLCDVPPSDCVE